MPPWPVSHRRMTRTPAGGECIGAKLLGTKQHRRAVIAGSLRVKLPSRQLVRSDANIAPIMASDRLQRQIERLLDEADQAITREDWPTVSSRARSVLAIDPENSEGIAYLAAAERALGTPAGSTTLDPPLVRGDERGVTPTLSPNPSPTLTETPSRPTSFANGRYQVKRFLGEGGKKRSTWPTTLCWTERWPLL